MATLINHSGTLLDMAKRLGPDGRKVSAIIEMLNEYNPVLKDATVIEGNLPYGHQSTIRTGLPEGTWRKLYQGVQPTKSQTAQVVDQAGRLEAYGQVDCAMPGDIQGWRESEAKAQIEGMSQQISDAIFYGDTKVNPAQFNGLSMRYSSKSAVNGQNIIDAGGTGNDNRSIWLVAWDPMKCTMFYPQMRTGYNVPTGHLGVMHEDLGRVTTETIGGTANGGLAEVYRDHYVAELGLCVPDWRWVVRIANIDLATLKADRSSGANIEDLIVRAIGRLGGNTDSKGSRVAAYADRNVLIWLHRQMLNSKHAYIPMNQPGGMVSLDDLLSVVFGGGLRAKACDSLNRSEARVT